MKNILYVEDDEIIRKILSFVLSKKFNVYVAEDGQKGLETFKKHQNDIDLIISDINMPKLNGLDMIKQIKEIKDLPVYFISAFDDHYVKEKINSLNVNRYILKPFDINILMDNINKDLGIEF